jgi:hypothetical protein
MGADIEDEGADVVIALAPNVASINTVTDVEPPYGWVVCISLHFINAFTWGVIAVREHLPY